MWCAVYKRPGDLLASVKTIRVRTRASAREGKSSEDEVTWLTPQGGFRCVHRSNGLTFTLDYSDEADPLLWNFPFGYGPLFLASRRHDRIRLTVRVSLPGDGYMSSYMLYSLVRTGSTLVSTWSNLDALGFISNELRLESLENLTSARRPEVGAMHVR